MYHEKNARRGMRTAPGYFFNIDNYCVIITTPVITGAAAVFKSAYPDASPEWIKDKILLLFGY